jgi:hypothetical protein
MCGKVGIPLQWWRAHESAFAVMCVEQALRELAGRALQHRLTGERRGGE